MRQANATFSVIRWDRGRWEDQAPFQEGELELFHMEVEVRYQGDLDGEGTIRYLLADNGDRKGGFVGLEKVTGTVAGRSGSFVFQHTGTFDNGHIVDTLIVLPGSGDGALRGISGTVLFDFPGHLATYPFVFHFEV